MIKAAFKTFERTSGDDQPESPRRASVFRQASALTALLIFVSAISACAQLDTVGSKLGLGGQALTVDPSDACYRQRSAFNDSPNFLTDRIVTSALFGAGGGALVGLGAAAATHGNLVAGALIGGLAGAVGGAAVGYMSALQQEHLDQAQLSRQVDDDLSTEGRNIDHIAVAFTAVRDCRFAQANRIKAMARSHQIPPDVARSEMAYQRDRFNEELALARTYNINMGKHADQFQYAATKLRSSNAPNSRKIQETATETIPEKRSHFDNNVESATSTAQVAFDTDALPKSSSREMPQYA